MKAYTLTWIQIPVTTSEIIHYMLSLIRHVQSNEAETFYIREEISKVLPVIINRKQLKMNYKKLSYKGSE